LIFCDMAEDGANLESKVEQLDLEPTGDGKEAKEGLGDRMKKYEAQNMHKVDVTLPWLVRLDGHKFSSFTRPFKRPFDDRIHNCMTAACKALLVEFHPTIVYTCSDEITLVFPSFESMTPVDPEEAATGDSEKKDGEKQEQVMMFGGRIQKIATLMASLASVAFDRELRLQTFDAATEQKLIDYIAEHPPYFDARIFNVPNVTEIVSNLIWRSHHDYRRNSISQYARSFYSPKQMHKLNSTQLCEMMKTEKGVNWEDLPGKYKYGSFFKRQQYIKTVEIKGETIQATRTRTVELSFCFNKNNDSVKDFLMSKYVGSDFDTFVIVTHA
jgi:tRNA(His) guanylyltransferase